MADVLYTLFINSFKLFKMKKKLFLLLLVVGMASCSNDDLGTDYKKNSTGAKSSKAVDWFNKWAGLNASSLKGYNENAIISAIKSGYPVLARGNSGKKKVLGIRVGWKGGHAWVYDGVLVASKDGKSNNFVHCNWGWGGYKNGYYISKAFNANAGAAIYDSSDNQ